MKSKRGKGNAIRAHFQIRLSISGVRPKGNSGVSAKRNKPDYASRACSQKGNSKGNTTNTARRRQLCPPFPKPHPRSALHPRPSHVVAKRNEGKKRSVVEKTEIEIGTPKLVGNRAQLARVRDFDVGRLPDVFAKVVISFTVLLLFFSFVSFQFVYSFLNVLSIVNLSFLPPVFFISDQGRKLLSIIYSPFEFLLQACMLEE